MSCLGQCFPSSFLLGCRPSFCPSRLDLAHPLQSGRSGSLEKSRKKEVLDPTKFHAGLCDSCFPVSLFSCLPVCFVCLLACRRGSREPRVAEREEQTRRKDQSHYRGKGRSGREVLSLKGVYVEPRLIFRSMGLGGCGFLPLVLCVHLACPIDCQILLGGCAMGCCCCCCFFFSFLVCRS